MKDRLKQIRKEDPHGKTQDTFAEFLGISKQNISSYEMGRRKPSDGIIQLICSKCNINEEWLRSGTGKKDISISKNDEISKLFGNVLKLNDNNFKDKGNAQTLVFFFTFMLFYQCFNKNVY